MTSEFFLDRRRPAAQFLFSQLSCTPTTGAPISTAILSAEPAIFIDAPRHPNLKLLHDYWLSKRGDRAMPARSDISPAQMKAVLGDIMMWNVGRAGAPHVIRLVGENIVRFVGRNNTGETATFGMPEDAVAAMNGVIDTVASARAPRFRIGKAYWLREKAYREFEACYLPLSADGQTVDMILGGVVFDVTRAS